MEAFFALLKISFLTGYALLAATLPSWLLPLSASSILLFSFIIFMLYPVINIFKSLFRENPKYNKEVIKKSLRISLIFSFISPIILFIVLSVPTYSQAFEIFGLPILAGVGLCASFYLYMILIGYNNLLNPKNSKDNISIPYILVCLILVFLSSFFVFRYFGLL